MTPSGAGCGQDISDGVGRVVPGRAVMDDITYGTLMHRAEDHLKVAWRQLHHAPPTDASAIRDAVLAFKEVGHALTQLANHLTGDALDGSRHGLPVDPRLRVAMRLSDALLTDFPKRSEPLQNLEEFSLAARLKAAAVAMRTATDLLATHRSPEGHWQTPESVALADRSLRLTALARVGDLAVAMSYAQPELVKTRRLDSTVIPWMRSNPVPRMAAARDLARELRSLIPPAEDTIIDNTRVATPRIRYGEPVIELQDRVERLRVAAWRAAVYPTVETGVPTLIDFATAAVMLHARAALLGARDSDVDVRAPHAPADVKFLFNRGNRWRGVRRRLLALLSPSVPDPAVAEDVRALRELLGDLTNRNGIFKHLAIANPRFTGVVEPHELTATVRALDGVFEAIAASNTITLRALSSARLLRTPGKLLPADPQVATLSEGFTRTSVPVTDKYLRLVFASYEGVQSGPGLAIPDVFRPPRVRDISEPDPGL